MNMHYLLALVVVAVCAEQDPCDDFYCANGGVCILEDHEHSHSCEDRQTSENIESNEDRNSGEDGQSGEGRHSGGHRHFVPTCQCIGDWKGDRCDDNPCQFINCNTGSCYFDGNGSPHCCCPTGTTGEFCEIIEDPCNNVNCNEGTCSADGNNQTVCSCPESRSGQFCEIAVCPQLESPTNGLVTLEDTTIGSTATYTCDSPTMAVCIHENLTCGDDGEWDKEPPVCVEQFDRDTSLTVLYGDSTYYFSNEKLTFSDSQAFCENLGGNLVSINSEEENEFINCLYRQRNFFGPNDPLFIGLHKVEGEWIWTSGEPVTVTEWWDLGGQDNINAKCANLHDNSAWVPYDLFSCQVRKEYFLCEKSVES